MLLKEYSSAFNAIEPSVLFIKLRDLGVNTAGWDCILEGRPRVVWIGTTTYPTLTLNIESPYCCRLSLLSTVERVRIFRFLVVHIIEGLTWTHRKHKMMKTARHRL